jgi:hypothetical protein
LTSYNDLLDDDLLENDLLDNDRWTMIAEQRLRDLDRIG